MKQIRLANGKGVALVDDEDFGVVSARKWYLHGQGYAACTPDKNGCSLLHRLVFGATTGQEIDHINGDKLDCRRSNLRSVTRSQNNQNRPKGAQVNNRLGVRGVSMQPHRWPPQYFVRVQHKGKVTHRCGFRSLEEAADAARELRRQLFTHSGESH